jgi:hypothetical protein
MQTYRVDVALYLNANSANEAVRIVWRTLFPHHMAAYDNREHILRFECVTDSARLANETELERIDGKHWTYWTTRD